MLLHTHTQSRDNLNRRSDRRGADVTRLQEVV